MKKLEASLTIGRLDTDTVRITIEDDEARVLAVQVDVEIGIFARALMASGCQPCVMTFNDTGTVGTIGQNKAEVVPIPPYDERTGDWEEKAVRPFEVDGWHARMSDVDNRHCQFRKGDKCYARVTFFRHVPREGS